MVCFSTHCINRFLIANDSIGLSAELCAKFLLRIQTYCKMSQICIKLSIAILLCTILEISPVQSDSPITCKIYCDNKCVFGRHPLTGQCIEPNIHCDCGSNATLYFVLFVVTVLATGRIIARCFCYPLGVTSARIGLPSCVYSQDATGQSNVSGTGIDNELCDVTTANTNDPPCQEIEIQNSSTNSMEIIGDPPPSYADATTGVQKE